MYKIGCGKANITILLYGKGMMGYGMHENVAKGIETPISVRAFVIEQTTSNALDKALLAPQRIVMVNAEICFYTLAIKHEVIKRLQAARPDAGYTDANVLLAAQHTHSAPGGYSHYLLYNLTIPGFQPQVFEKYVSGTVAAILQAESNLKPAEMRYAEADFDPYTEVAFNRSLAAFNANKEISQAFGEHEAHLAIDRTMKLLRFDEYRKDKKAASQPLGVMNWFGVHTTSLSNDNSKICYDNKGYAADYLEQHLRQQYENPQIITAFNQDTAGDVSPNFVWDKKKKWMRGKYEDDFKSARFNGKLQYEKAQEAFERAAQQKAISGNIDYALTFVNFAHVAIDPQFVEGKTGLRTMPSAQGISFFEGTKEGPGMPKTLTTLAKLLIGGGRLYERLFTYRRADAETRRMIDLKYELHGKKHIFMESGEGRVFGITKTSQLPLPNVDLYIKYFKWLDKHGYLARTPWIPQILPIQIIILGDLAILGVAGELTTMAGKRLSETVLSVLQERGVKKVIPTTYANGYHGYITTPEEYEKQLYEGGHTVFGKWSLPAYQTKFRELAQQMLLPAAQRQIDTLTQPDIFKPEEIWYGFEKPKVPKSEVAPQLSTTV
jgi:neutral ceramidase